MQIHLPIPHGLLYSVEPLELAKFHLNDNATHDDFEWEKYEAEYVDESLASNVISFLKEFSRGS